MEKKQPQEKNRTSQQRIRRYKEENGNFIIEKCYKQNKNLIEWVQQYNGGDERISELDDIATELPSLTNREQIDWKNN